MREVLVQLDISEAEQLALHPGQLFVFMEPMVRLTAHRKRPPNNAPMIMVANM